MNDQSRPGFLKSPHPLTNFEAPKYFQNEHKLNDVYSINNLPEKKDGTDVIDFEESKSIETHLM